MLRAQVWSRVEDVRVASARAVAMCALSSAALGALGRDLSWAWFGTSLRVDALRWVTLLALSAASWWVSVPRESRATNALARFVLAGVGVLACIDVAGCASAVRSGRLHALTPIPFSAVLAVLCFALSARVPRRELHRSNAGTLGSVVRVGLVVVAVVSLVGAEVAGVAYTDYRRSADAIVVLGAGVHADGSPSEALQQRMATACELYAGGYAPLFIVSGGQGRVGPTEPEVMRRLALQCGVPDAAIIVDEQGVDTRATAFGAARIAHERSLRTVLAVSHGYHLARVGLALRRAGVQAVTVPARERRALPAKPYYVARELLAYVIYAVAMSSA